MVLEDLSVSVLLQNLHNSTVRLLVQVAGPKGCVKLAPDHQLVLHCSLTAASCGLDLDLAAYNTHLLSI